MGGRVQNSHTPCSFPLESNIAAIRQELVPPGPAGSLTHTCTSCHPEMLTVGSQPSLPKEKGGRDSRSQVRAVESRQDEMEKPTKEINHGTRFQPGRGTKYQVPPKESLSQKSAGYESSPWVQGCIQGGEQGQVGALGIGCSGQAGFMRWQQLQPL